MVAARHGHGGASSERAWAASETASHPALLLRPPEARARSPRQRARRPGRRPWASPLRPGRRPRPSSRHEDREASSRATLRSPRRPGPASPRMGFRLFADPPPCVQHGDPRQHVPDGVEWSSGQQETCAVVALVIAGGQGSLTGKIFRVGHLGDVNVDDILPRPRDAGGGCHRPGASRSTRVLAPRAAKAAANRCRCLEPGARPGRPARQPRCPSMTTAAATPGARARVLVVEQLAAEGLALLRAAHDVDERVGIPRRGLVPGHPCPSTTRCWSAARCRWMPRPSRPASA